MGYLSWLCWGLFDSCGCCWPGFCFGWSLRVFFFLSLVVEVSFVIAIEVYIGSFSVKSYYM